MTAQAPATTLARVVALRRMVSEHKAAIRQHRVALQRDKAALVALEAECQRRGLGITTRSVLDARAAGGAGGSLHGHDPAHRP